jgi:hypothetical protein
VKLYEVTLDGLDTLPDLDTAPERIVRIVRMGINKTVDRARVRAAGAMRSQVNFPASYLRGEDSRLFVKKKAVGNDLEAIVSGRHRPTSLARFAKNAGPTAGRSRAGVSVEVKPGEAQFLKNAFFVRLRAGSAKTDTKYNLGIAVRLKSGQRPRNSRAAVQLDRNLWLLYGPSVNQVFQTVREDIAPDTRDYLVAEVERLLGVENL